MNNIALNKHDIKSDDFVNSAENIKTSGKYLLGIAAADERVINSKFSVRYFFGGTECIEEYCVKTEESFRSISKICPAAKMYEREIYDLFGLLPEGHPDLRPLMLYPENWDSSIHPLRKEENSNIINGT